MTSNEPEYKYALKNIFSAHSADVRVVKATIIPEGGIVSGSRDNFVKVWSPDGASFKESQSFCGARNYISSLCVLPPTEQYPLGIILAGSHDCSIYGFTSQSPDPVFRLLGHSGAVCSLSSGNFGFIVSGSWDKTARVWSGQQCSLILQGHTQAVWATEIFPTQNLILTGSADCTIRLWRSGVCEKVFSGHEDCVRKLAVISDKKFLSCSNDNSIRLWLTSGECLEVYKDHSDYIYDLALLSNGIDFATCGEDQNIKVWKAGDCVQTFVVAPKSLWSVARLSNGDLAVGTSEGKIYVFEKVPVDYFENAAASAGENTSEANTDAEFNLAGKSVNDGETLIMHEKGHSDMYICKYYHTAGVKIKKQPLDLQLISDIFCKKSETSSNSDKVNKKADYVFDVNVEDNMYKLAFNRGENPWDVANKFVAEHNLLTDHVSQIVEFIIQNTASSTQENEFFPAKTYLIYSNLNLPGLKAKLLEFSQKVPKDNCVSLDEIEKLTVLASTPSELSIEVLSILDKVISWNDELIFPVLDLLRIGVTGKGLQTKIHSKEFLNHLLHILKHTNKSVNRVLVAKIFCNMFGLNGAHSVLEPYQDKIFEYIKNAICNLDMNIQKAGSALFLNFAIASYYGFNINTNVYCLNVVEILNYLSDSEAIMRMLVAVGTVCLQNPLAITFFRSLDIRKVSAKFNEYSSDSKISRILALLQGFF